MADLFRYPRDEYILLGKVAKAHGLRGELKIICFSGEPENIKHYKHLVFVGNEGRLSMPFAIRDSRKQSKSAIVKLVDIENRNEAERFEGLGVLLGKDQLPRLEKNEYYWHNLEGKLIKDKAHNEIGEVETLFNNGAQDILVVRGRYGEIFIPVTPEIVIGEDEETLIIDPPPGLLELNVDK